MSRIDEYQAALLDLVKHFKTARAIYMAATADANAPGNYDSWKRWVGGYSHFPTPANQILIIEWSKRVIKHPKG